MNTDNFILDFLEIKSFFYLLYRVAIVLVSCLVDLVGGVVSVVDGLVLVVPGPGAKGLNIDGVTGHSGAAQHTGDQQ